MFNSMHGGAIKLSGNTLEIDGEELKIFKRALKTAVEQEKIYKAPLSSAPRRAPLDVNNNVFFIDGKCSDIGPYKACDAFAAQKRGEMCPSEDYALYPYVAEKKSGSLCYPNLNYSKINQDAKLKKRAQARQAILQLIKVLAAFKDEDGTDEMCEVINKMTQVPPAVRSEYCSGLKSKDAAGNSVPLCSYNAGSQTCSSKKKVPIRRGLERPPPFFPSPPSRDEDDPGNDNENIEGFEDAKDEEDASKKREDAPSSSDSSDSSDEEEVQPFIFTLGNVTISATREDTIEQLRAISQIDDIKRLNIQFKERDNDLKRSSINKLAQLIQRQLGRSLDLETIENNAKHLANIVGRSEAILGRTTITANNLDAFAQLGRIFGMEEFETLNKQYHDKTGTYFWKKRDIDTEASVIQRTYLDPFVNVETHLRPRLKALADRSPPAPPEPEEVSRPPGPPRRGDRPPGPPRRGDEEKPPEVSRSPPFSPGTESVPPLTFKLGDVTITANTNQEKLVLNEIQKLKSIGNLPSLLKGTRTANRRPQINTLANDIQNNLGSLDLNMVDTRAQRIVAPPAADSSSSSQAPSQQAPSQQAPSQQAPSQQSLNLADMTLAQLDKQGLGNLLGDD